MGNKAFIQDRPGLIPKEKESRRMAVLSYMLMAFIIGMEKTKKKLTERMEFGIGE